MVVYEDHRPHNRDHFAFYCENSAMTLKELRLETAMELVLARSNTICMGDTAWKTNQVPASIKFDGHNHIPGTRGQKNCSFPGCKHKSIFYCQKCNTHLCLTKERNHYEDFHQNKSYLMYIYLFYLPPMLICAHKRIETESFKCVMYLLEK